jgi:hypothetical protein
MKFGLATSGKGIDGWIGYQQNDGKVEATVKLGLCALLIQARILQSFRRLGGRRALNAMRFSDVKRWTKAVVNGVITVLALMTFAVLVVFVRILTFHRERAA